MCNLQKILQVVNGKISLETKAFKSRRRRASSAPPHSSMTSSRLTANCIICKFSLNKIVLISFICYNKRKYWITNHMALNLSNPKLIKEWNKIKDSNILNEVFKKFE